VVVVVVAGALGALALTWGNPSGKARGGQPVFEVRRGPLTISVVESGTIQSLEQVSLKSEVEGQNTLIFLVPEGTAVKKGDLLVELDASRLQDDLTQQQISVDNAEASFIRARESLAVAKNQAASDISKAELDYQFAQEDVKQYVEGEHPQEVKEAESNITLAREELERAADKVKWSERLYEEKYISQMDLDADKLAFKRAELNHELAVTSLDLLQNYTSKRRVTELESNVEQMAMALERVELQSNADIVQAQADLKAKETELRQQRSKLEKIENQIAKTRIVAPRDGLVVYATSVEGGRRRHQEPLEEGQAIRERQELIYLPSAESMMAEVQIHESSLEKIRVGLPVIVKIDAIPGESFTGRVAKIAPLPDARSAWINPDLKVYPTQIHLDGTHPELRTGMSCQAEIIVERHDDACYVPVQAVTRVGNVPTVYLRAGDRFEAKSIEVGLDNNSMIHVVDGLDAGQEVLLTPPLEGSTLLGGDRLAEADADPELTKRRLEESKRQPDGAGGDAGHRNERASRRTPAGDTATGGHEETTGDSDTGMPPRAPGAMQQGFGDMTPEQRNAMRERFQNMSPEEREAMRQRFMNMSPEEREAMRQRFGGGGGRPSEGGASARERRPSRSQDRPRGDE
jgi:HlyD family secretion protein